MIKKGYFRHILAIFQCFMQIPKYAFIPIEQARSMGAFSKYYAFAKLCRMPVCSKTVSTVCI